MAGLELLLARLAGTVAGAIARSLLTPRPGAALVGDPVRPLPRPLGQDAPRRPAKVLAGRLSDAYASLPEHERQAAADSVQDTFAAAVVKGHSPRTDGGSTPRAAAASGGAEPLTSRLLGRFVTSGLSPRTRRALQGQQPAGDGPLPLGGAAHTANAGPVSVHRASRPVAAAANGPTRQPHARLLCDSNEC
ncbi:hypothetical protein ACIBJC_30320 [Streptomyces sp. NPDC050509]|uniref:NACHT N-terminal Helical domain 1-containing protein n=1 Tax=Streptomyces sp. NPDC050509 TaxID=3365620 RepID=UPI003799FB30